ncbi:MAG: M20/M25/M40 family metallo-hydrolase [Planctomycetes bacterium]|nr:M20/M25/M40 family metallo-hydrolase [Planctomycetota bacterium]
MNLLRIAVALVLSTAGLAQEPPPASPPAIGAEVARLLANVDAERIDTTVRKLVGFGTRHVLSRTDSDTEGTGAARRWLRAEFDAIAAASGGRLTVALQEAVVPCTRPGMPRELAIVNVIATLRGSSDPDRVYVVGGHYDSRNGDGADGKELAPGAVDDASGTAVALEACRVLAARAFPATIVFVAYDAEEQGLLGSAAHAKALVDSGVRVDGMIGCDIVGNTLGMDGRRHDRHVRCFSYAPSGNDSLGRSMARAVAFAARTYVPEFGVKLIWRGDRYGRGGDHRSFFEQGVPAVRLSEPREDFSRQHQNVVERDGAPYGDLPAWFDRAYTARVTQVVVATLAELASAPPPPRVVNAQLRRDRYDTELVYELPEGIACEFVWRETTDADWTHTIDMAAAAPRATASGRWLATLSSVCLDDVVVGVRAVGADGSRSRVATPPEPDRFDQRARAPRGTETTGR